MGISFVVRLEEMSGNLSAAESRIASYFRDNLSTLPGTGIPEVAQSAQVSKAAVVRLCKKLGYQGYKEFRQALSVDLALRRANASPPVQTTLQGMTAAQAAVMALSLALDIVREAQRTLDIVRFEEAVTMLMRHQTMRIISWGGANILALDAQQKFITLGYIAAWAHDERAREHALQSMRPGELVLLLFGEHHIDEVNRARETVSGLGAESLVIAADLPLHPPVPGSLVLGVSLRGHLRAYGSLETNLAGNLLLNSLYLALAAAIPHTPLPALMHAQHDAGIITGQEALAL